MTTSTTGSLAEINYNLFCDSLTADRNLKKRLINDRKKHFYYLSETKTKTSIVILLGVLTIILMIVLAIFYLRD